MRRPAPRTLVLVAVVLGVLVAVGLDLWSTVRTRRRVADAAPSSSAAPLDRVLSTPGLLVRSTLPGDQYGLVAQVPLSDPAGPRTATATACDRIARAGTSTVCLRTVRGVVTTYQAELLDAQGETVQHWALPGIPSRTRSSPDGSLIATTSYVANHCAAQVAPPTETRIRTADGTDLGNLEQWTLLVDGAPFTAVDRNLWDVSFVDDDTFYVTVGAQSAGTTWIARGSVATRTITSVHAGGTTPSVSPDGSRIAFVTSDRTADGGQVQVYALLDIGSGTTTVYPRTTGAGDQVEWLDDTTFLYGVPRADLPGTSDVWALDTTAADPTPVVLVPGAASPTVVGATP